MSAVPAAAPLDLVTVRRKIKDARRLLAAAVALLGELYDGQAWKALGYASWPEMCAAELPELAQLLTVAEKKALVVDLRQRGMSLRAAAAPAGVSAPTAKTWLDDAGVQLASVTSLDGRTRPASSSVAKPATPRRRRTPLTDRVVLLLASAGPDGLTVRDIARELRTERHLIAPTLTRLEDAGRIVYRRPARRGLFGTYVGRIVP